MGSSIQGLFRPNTATRKSWALCGKVLKNNVFIGAWVRTLQKMMARAGVRGKAFQRVERFSPRVPASYKVQCGGVRAPDMALQITEMRTSIWPGWVPSTWHRYLLELLHPFHKPVAQVSSRFSPAGSEGFRHWLLPGSQGRFTRVVKCRVSLVVCPHQSEPWGASLGSSHRYNQGWYSCLWHTNQKGQRVTAVFKPWFQFHGEEKGSK